MTPLDLVRDWCRIPSVRGNDRALARQAAALSDWLRRELGAEIIPAQDPKRRAPIVHARLDAGAARTVIVYNMYDVMPADPGGWSVDPWEGGVLDLDGIGPCFVARGAENNKGPLAGTLCALATMGSLPVNVECLFEGEEESGSAALRDYLLDPGCPVRPGVAALFPSFCEYGGGPPRIYLGSSGIAKGRVSVRGGAWGGPSAAIHSSNAPWIANPARRLVAALAAFGTDPAGALDRIDLDAAACEVIDAIPFDPQAELRFRRTQRYVQEGETPGDRLRRVLSTVSVNISALATDPPGADATIPAAAHATFDLRCPPPLDPACYVDRLRAALPPGAVLHVADSYPGHRFAPDSPAVAALQSAYRATSRPAQVWPWAIGAAPAYAFARHAPCFLLGGAGRGGNAHAPDEFLTLEGFDRFIRSVQLWIGTL